jgi:hypothetical protein
MTHNSAPCPSHVSNHFPPRCPAHYIWTLLSPIGTTPQTGTGEYFTTKPRVMPSLDVHSRTNNNGEVLWWRLALLWVPAWSTTNVGICSPCLLAKPQYSMQLITWTEWDTSQFCIHFKSPDLQGCTKYKVKHVIAPKIIRVILESKLLLIICCN